MERWAEMSEKNGVKFNLNKKLIDVVGDGYKINEGCMNTKGSEGHNGWSRKQ